MTRFIAILTILIPTTYSFALDGDVTLTLNVMKQSDKRVRLDGTTNLPPGTKLMLSVSEKIENGFLGQSSCFVSSDGTFESEAFGPKGGLEDGRYTADATMPIPRIQSAEVKRIIGSNGENLSGPLVEKGRFGVTVSQQVAFAIGENADAAQAERKGKAEASTAALKKSVCVLLEQLLEFKDEPNFKKFGFAIAGPYNKWLKNVEALRDSTPTGQHPIPLIVRAAPGDLLMMGMNYLRGETDYTRQMLPELKKTIDFEAYLDAKRKSKTEAPTTLRTWRDSTGKFSVDATFVEKRKAHVVLRRHDGSTVSILITKLSVADVEFVRRQASN